MVTKANLLICHPESSLVLYFSLHSLLSALGGGGLEQAVLPGEGLRGDGGEKVRSPWVAARPGGWAHPGWPPLPPQALASSQPGRQSVGLQQVKQAAGSQSWHENKIIALC